MIACTAISIYGTAVLWLGVGLFWGYLLTDHSRRRRR